MNWSLACASAVTGAAAATAAAARMRWENFMVCLLVEVGEGTLSMRERPEPQFLLAGGPELGQAMRLDDEEPDDQPAEDHQLGVRDAGRGDRQPEHAREHRQELV